MFTLKVMQINANHCRDAHYLLRSTAAELGADVVAVAEPLGDSGGGWTNGNNGGVAMWVIGFNGRSAQDDLTVIADVYVAVVIDSLMLVSVYLRPNVSIGVYQEQVAELEELSASWGGAIMFVSDFNAKSPEWGSGAQNRRGQILLDMIARRSLYPIKAMGSRHTFCNGRGARSLVDFAFCDLGTLRAIRRSKILKKETRSDHLYVVHEVGAPEFRPSLPLFKWTVRTLDSERMKEVYDEKVRGLDPNEEWDEAAVVGHQRAIRAACGRSMRAAGAPRRSKAVGFAGWTPELKELRKATYRLRRRKQRACKRDLSTAGPLIEEYKAACKALHKGMVRARVVAWENLCGNLNSDMWGKPFRIVMAKLRAREPPPNLTVDMAERVFGELFPIPDDPELRENPLHEIPYPDRQPDEDPQEWKIGEAEL